MKACICFSHTLIRDIELEIPVLPRKGESIIFDPGMVKYSNGAESDINSYRVKAVTYYITKDLKTRVEVNVGLD